MILENGIVRTLDAAGGATDSLAVSRELVVERAGGERIDLDGCCVVPGFTDSHVHFPTWSIARRQVRLEDCRTLALSLHCKIAEPRKFLLPRQSVTYVERPVISASSRQNGGSAMAGNAARIRVLIAVALLFSLALPSLAHAQTASFIARRDFPSSVVVADFNGDGVQDLAVASSASGSTLVSVLLGNGDGTFQAAKNSGGPNFSANFATSGARKVIITTATKAPTKDEVNAAVSALPACPCCAMG